MTSPTVTKKRSRIFDTVHALESEDVHAEQKRRIQTSKRDAKLAPAAQAQTQISHRLVECRILLQQAMNNDSEDAGDDRQKLLVKLLEARRKLLGWEDDKDYGAMDASALEGTMQGEYDKCREVWKEVLDRRQSDARLHSGITAKSHFKVLSSSFWQQVEATAQHEQLQRQQNSAAFDDSKVYQQLLKDFVAANEGGDVRSARQRLAKKQGSAKKAAVDRKASKGRRLRYNEIPKLVNFTFPLSRSKPPTNLGDDEWFRSLFGGVAREHH